MKYTCVQDGKMYDPLTTRAEIRGFCSQRCLHEFERANLSRQAKNKYGRPIYSQNWFHERSRKIWQARMKTKGAEPLSPEARKVVEENE